MTATDRGRKSMIRACTFFFIFLAGLGCQAQEVQVTADGVALSAELRLPEQSVCKACPLIVVVQGSGDSDRNNPWTAAWTDALVAQGVAVLHTDKRGSGHSGGDWRAVGFERLADDILAFLDVMEQHERIDPSRTGVMGFSQGGHVVSLFAEEGGPVDFVISLSASVVSMDQQILDETLLQGKQDGLGDEQMAAITGIHHAAMKFAEGGQSYAVVEKALETARDVGLADYGFVEGFPGPEVEWLWPWLAKIKDFDPMAQWKSAAKPVLFIYGGQDTNVDAQQSVDLIRRELLDTGKAITVIVHNENGHALYRKDTVALVASFAIHGGNND